MSQPLVFDGAFGTYYLQKSNNDGLPEAAVMSNPALVLDIHREYIAAGAQAIKTDTFCANSLLFPKEQRDAIVHAAYGLAKEAAGDAARVFADIGPAALDDPKAEYREIADVFLALGAQDFLFETFPDAESLTEIAAYIKARQPKATVIFSFAVSQDGYSANGAHYLDLLQAAQALGADFAGLNCVCGPAHMLELARGAKGLDIPLCFMSNAGYPMAQNGRTVYVDNPDYFADKMAQIAGLGAGIVGGCCGTTPAHIRALRQALHHPLHATPAAKPPEKPHTAKAAAARGGKLIAVEVGAPADTDMTYALEAARSAQEAGADFVTVPDSPLARTRANSMMTAARIQREVGIDAIPHICCRDKNQIALKGDLIAGHIEGIRRILAITGDPISDVDRGQKPGVFGLNAFRLISYVERLNQDIFADAPFSICAALNINAANFKAELGRAKRKEENGADCLFTQPIFSREGLEHFLEARAALKVRLIAGIMPVSGYKNAVFLNNEIPGIKIPGALIHQLEGKGRQASREISLAHCRELIDQAAPHSDGFYIVTPLRRIEYSAALVEYIRQTHMRGQEL